MVARFPDVLFNGDFIPMSFGNPTFVHFILWRASRLPLNGLRSQAGRLRYIQKSISKLLLV
jgi:hypothetical protein